MTYSRIQTELRAGKIPTSEMIDGLFILIGGIVLLTPGLLTDIAGFALLVPWVRNQLKIWARNKFTSMTETGQHGVFSENVQLPPGLFR